MLIFQQKESDASDKTDGKFYVISTRRAINEQLCQQFRLVGFNAVEGIERDITHTASLNIPGNANGVVVDIGNNTQVADVFNALQIQIPRQVWCCVVGDSDSIALAQDFAANQIGYFNVSMQQDMIIQAALSGIEIKNHRTAVSISVLGCKGGVGSTTIAYQLAVEISRLKELPTLFVQGNSGSRDLDLHAGKKMSQDITSLQKNLDLMCSNSNTFPNLQLEGMHQYNFVLFEQSINTADKELLRHLAESSHCIVLVIERSMASVRVARNMIENIELLQRISRTSRRFFICLNDSRPVSMEMLSLSDIKALLNHQIDITFPFSKKKNPAKKRKSRFSPSPSPLNQLTRAVLGQKKEQNKSVMNRIFYRIHRGN